MRKLVLFDIDGTLLWTDGAGRSAIRGALLAEMGLTGPIDRFRFDGKTDPQIVTELLVAAGHPEPAAARCVDQVCRRYAGLLSAELRKRSGSIRLFPGVPELLNGIDARSGALLGLLTGNIADGARLKLEAAGLDPARFRVGAYGSDAPNRDALPRIAMDRAARLVNGRFEGEDVVIIGDTPADMTCGRNVGARAIGVATGSFAPTTLWAAGAYAVFGVVGPDGRGAGRHLRMTNPKLLLPLRIPELGPSLGKLVTGTGRTPGGLRLDDVRYRLVTRILECAGEGRRLAAREERNAAIAAVGRTAWLEAWEEAVAGAAERLTERVTARLDGEAEAVRMPKRLRRWVELDAAESRALTARLGSAGATLVPALDALQSQADRAVRATALERDAVEAWQEALRTAARRMEAAWFALEDAVDAEAVRWEAVADDIGRWRRSLWPVVLVGLLGLAGAVWLGLVLGGYLPSPSWLTSLWQSAFGP